jgi:hypothetical protein
MEDCGIGKAHHLLAGILSALFVYKKSQGEAGTMTRSIQLFGCQIHGRSDLNRRSHFNSRMGH